MEFTGERFLPIQSLMEDEIGIEHLHRYYSSLSLVKDKVVLDLACGEGYGTALLAEKAIKAIGVDIDHSCIKHANQKYTGKIKNLSFLQGDASAIPLETNSIDVVTSFETIEHLDEETQQAFIKEVKRVLKKEGVLIISTPDKTNYSDRYSYNNEFHIKEFTANEFFSFLKSNFNYLATFLQGFEIVSAITEPNTSDLNQVKVQNLNRSTKHFSRKYLICICSNEPLKKEDNISSVVFDVHKDYLKLTDRMVEMNSHIQELGAWGKELDERIAEKDNLISDLQNMLTSHSNQATDLEEQNKMQSDLIYKLTTTNLEKDRKVQELYELVNARDSKIQQQSELLATKDLQILELRALINEKKSKVQELTEVLVDKESLLAELINKIQSDKVVVDIALSEKQANILDLENEHRRQNSIIEEQAAIISALNSKYDAQSVHANELQSTLSKLEVELIDSKNIILEQNQKNNLLYHQIDSLNGRLEEIFISEGWKLLKRYYNLKGRLLPEDSQRYRVIKRVVNNIRGKHNEDFYVRPNPGQQLQTAIEPYLIEEAAISVSKEYHKISLPLFELPSVSIVIPAYNAWEMNYNCISSIKENTFGVSYEVIIGDDASNDETKEIKAYIENVVSVRSETNLGFLQNCNNAAKYAKGKYILFLNNDTEVKPGWLSSLVDLIEKDHKIGMTGSKLVYPDGRLQEAGGIIWNDASGWNFGHKQSPDAPEFNYVKEVDYISGASILIRKKLWEEIGGFDPIYCPAYYEDTDLAFEVRKRGYKVVYQPLSEVVHYEGYSHGTEQREGITGKEIKAYQKVNFGKFYEKWKHVLENDHFPNAVNVFWARDRSKSKKTILFVDHYVPFFDKDAGSRNTYMILRLLAEMGYNVKFIGDNYYRHEPYTTSLQQLGIEVLYGAWYRDNWQNWVIDNKDKIDFVYLSRPHISIKYIDFIKQNLASKIIYFGHDLHYLRELKQYHVEKREELLESSVKWQKLETELFNKSDLVLTVSEEERNVMVNELKIQHVSKIPIFYYDKFNSPIKDFDKRKDILFIGGFNHSPNVDGILWFSNHIWPMISDKHDDINFIIAGSNPPQEILNLASSRIHIKGYVTDEELETLYSAVRLVVIPLRFGAGVKGKTVEAMYHGLPIVTTSYGIEGLSEIERVIKPCHNVEEFANQVIEKYSSPDMLEYQSQLEIQYIKSYFSRTNMEVALEEIFN